MKKIISFLLLTLSTLSITFGFSSWIINKDVEVGVTPTYVASTGIIENYTYDGKNESSSPYARFTTLEGALNSANEKAKSTQIHMYLTVGSNMVVENHNLVLNSGVSLYLPYEGKTCFTDSESDYKAYIGTDLASSNDTNKCKSSIELSNSSLLIKSGASLTIGAEVGQRGVASRFGKVSLSESYIEVEGELFAYGFVVEKSPKYSSNDDYRNNEDKEYVHVKSGGYLKTPLAISDVPGGSPTTTLLDKNICPFTIFDFPSIQTYCRFYNGATMDALIRLSIAGQTASRVASVINVSGQSGLFLTSNSTSIQTTDNYLSVERIPVVNRKINAVSKFVINEDVSIGSIYIGTVTGIKNPIDTANYFLPLSSKINLHVLDGATLTIPHDVKFMPGSITYVHEGGKIINNASLVFYEQGFLDTLSSFHAKYYTDEPTAQLIVDGTLELGSNASIGAFIDTFSTNGKAKLDFSNTEKSNLTASCPEWTNGDNEKVISSGYFLNDASQKKKAQFLERSVVTSDSNGNMCWSGDYVSTHALTIRIDNRTTDYLYPIANYRVYQADSNTGSNEVELTNGLFEPNTPNADYKVNNESLYNGSTYQIGDGKFIKIVVTRAASSSFADSSLTYSSATYYEVGDDMELIIVPNNGTLVAIRDDNVSGTGSGNSSYGISETETGYSVTIDQAGPNAYVIFGTKFKFTASGVGALNIKAIYLFEGRTSANGNKNLSVDEYANLMGLKNKKKASKSCTTIANVLELTFYRDSWIKT